MRSAVAGMKVIAKAALSSEKPITLTMKITSSAMVPPIAAPSITSPSWP